MKQALITGGARGIGFGIAEAMLAARGTLTVIERDHPRYVGARIGIYNPAGEKVGRVGRLRNKEFLYVVGPDKVLSDTLAAQPGNAGKRHRP